MHSDRYSRMMQLVLHRAKTNQAITIGIFKGMVELQPFDPILTTSTQDATIRLFLTSEDPQPLLIMTPQVSGGMVGTLHVNEGRFPTRVAIVIARAFAIMLRQQLTLTFTPVLPFAEKSVPLPVQMGLVPVSLTKTRRVVPMRQLMTELLSRLRHSVPTVGQRNNTMENFQEVLADMGVANGSAEAFRLNTFLIPLLKQEGTLYVYAANPTVTAFDVVQAREYVPLRRPESNIRQFMQRLDSWESGTVMRVTMLSGRTFVYRNSVVYARDDRTPLCNINMNPQNDIYYATIRVGGEDMDALHTALEAVTALVVMLETDITLERAENAPFPTMEISDLEAPTLKPVPLPLAYLCGHAMLHVDNAEIVTQLRSRLIATLQKTDTLEGALRRLVATSDNDSRYRSNLLNTFRYYATTLTPKTHHVAAIEVERPPSVGGQTILVWP